ncbi:hypothetical protein V6N13_098240 [Hibiscus sabdariffa]|uniref:CMP/dCMP-type deaminase domain-containing protein n=1 Tax=Hibiscus sabdariffa TaxID=183260 RepID=A0ABR2ED69_9ROSI
MGSSGRIFIKVNMEFSGLLLNQSVHAEQFLIINLSLNVEPRLKYLAVSAAPCGHCRPFLQELHGTPNVKILFGLDDLLEKDIPLLHEPHQNDLSFCNDLCNDKISGGDDLKHAALEAANMSHVSYNGCPSRVALLDVEGKIYKGSYMESTAYNPRRRLWLTWRAVAEEAMRGLLVLFWWRK